MIRPFRASLAAALLVAASVAGAAQPVAAGCGVNVTFVNRENVTAKVDERESKSKVAPVIQGINWWKKLGDGTVSVPANGQRTRAYTTSFGCDIPKRYKFLVKSGGNSKTIYKPNEDGFTLNRNITVTIDF